jgi:hypothetical protein
MSDWPALLAAGASLLTVNGAALGVGLRELRRMGRKISVLEKENAVLRAEISAIVRGNGLALSVWTKGIDRRVRWLTPRAMRVIFAPLDLSDDQVLGRTFGEIFGSEVGRQIESLDRRAMSELDSTQIDIVQLHPDLLPMVIITTVTEDEEGKTVFQGIAIRLLDMAHLRNGENAQVLQRLVAADRQNRRAGARDELDLPPEDLTASRTATPAE